MCVRVWTFVRVLLVFCGCPLLLLPLSVVAVVVVVVLLLLLAVVPAARFVVFPCPAWQSDR